MKRTYTKPRLERRSNLRKMFSIRLPPEIKRKLDLMKDDDPTIVQKLRESISNFVEDEYILREGF